MRLVFSGAAHEVTGSCHYLEVGTSKFLVDCGMEQGVNIYENVDPPVVRHSVCACDTFTH